jgi:hypothetical protein
VIVFGMPDFLRTPKPKEPEQITTFWGFYRWYRLQSHECDAGTIIFSRRFRNVSRDRLDRWLWVALRLKAKEDNPTTCMHSGYPVLFCKQIDLCDCFDYGGIFDG